MPSCHQIRSPNQTRTGLKWRRIRPSRHAAAAARDAIKALIVANGFLEAQVEQLKPDVSSGYARGYYHGRFKTYTG